MMSGKIFLACKLFYLNFILKFVSEKSFLPIVLLQSRQYLSVYAL